jgi:hypothetical protein
MPQIVQIGDTGSTAEFPDDMTPDQIEDVLKQHFSQPEPEPQKPPQEKIGPLKTFGLKLAQEALPAAAGAVSATTLGGLGTRIPGPPLVKAGGGLLGGVAGWLAGPAIAKKAQDLGLDYFTPEFAQRLKARTEAGEQQNPNAAFMGDLAGMLLSSKRAPLTSLKDLGYRVGASLGMTGAQTAIQKGELPTGREAIESGIVGGLMGAPRALPEKAGRFIAKGLATLPRSTIEAFKGGEPNAIREQSSTPLPVQPAPGDSQKVGQGVSAPGQTAGAQAQPQTGKVEGKEVLLTPPQPGKPRQYNLDLSKVFTPQTAALMNQAAPEAGAPVRIKTNWTEDDIDPNNAPFATWKEGEFMRANRQTGEINVSAQDLEEWLKTVPEDQRGEALQSAFDEEWVHLKTNAKDAASYWGALTWLEKKIAAKRYTGNWEGSHPGTGQKLGDAALAEEALRYRLQQLNRGTPREIAEAFLKDRIGLKALDALEATVRNLREFAETSASASQKRLVKRLSGNLRDARAVMEQKPLTQSPTPDDPRDVIGEVSLMNGDQFNEWAAGRKGGFTKAAHDLGRNLGDKDLLQNLQAAERMARDEFKQAAANKDLDAMNGLAFKGQFFREAYEAATGTGSAMRHLQSTEPGYKPPFPAEQAADTQAAKSLGASPEAAQNTIHAQNGTILGPGPFAINKAYHGTGYKFDKFSKDKIGQGQGAQTYGWGLYFAENRDVAKKYSQEIAQSLTPDKDQLEKYFQPGKIVKSYAGHDRVLDFKWNNGDWTVTVIGVKKTPEGTWVEDPRESPRTHFSAPSQKELKEAGIPPREELYSVRLEAEPDDLIDYDKPLREQSPKVRQLAQEYVAAKMTEAGAFGDKNTKEETFWNGSPREFYNWLAETKFAMPNPVYRDDTLSDPKTASEWLASQGIKGIQYFDKQSRPKTKTVDVPVAMAQTEDAAIKHVTGNNPKENAKWTAKWSQPDQIWVVTKTEAPEKQTRNYVIFDDKHIKITGRNGEPAAPAALRKKGYKEEAPGQGQLFLPPVKPGEERQAPTASKPVTAFDLDHAGYASLQKSSDAILTDYQRNPDAKPSAKGLSLSHYTQELGSQFGQEIHPNQVYESYERNLYRRLFNASGETLQAIAKSLDLQSPARVADPVSRPERRADVARGELPGLGNRMQEHKLTPEEQGARIAARSRNNLIGRIAKSVLEPERKKLLPPKTSVEPEDLNLTGKSARPGFEDITTRDLANPKALGQVLTSDSRRSQHDPVSMTKRLTAITPKRGGPVYLVSTYPTRGQTMLLDPTVAKVRPHRTLETMLENWRPVATVLLHDPVQAFSQKFPDLSAWESEFGRRSRNAVEWGPESKLPQKRVALESAEAELQPSQPPIQRGPLTEREAGAVLDSLYDEVSNLDNPQDMRDLITGLSDRAERKALTPRDWNAISALDKIYDAIKAKWPQLTENQAYDQLLDEIHDLAVKSPNREAFTNQALERYAPKTEETAGVGQNQPAESQTRRDLTLPRFARRATGSVQESPALGEPDTRPARPGAFAPPEMLSEPAFKELQAKIADQHPYTPTPIPQEIPAALNKRIKSGQEAVKAIGQAMSASVARRQARESTRYLLDSADATAALMTKNEVSRITLASMPKVTSPDKSFLGHARSMWKASGEAKMRRKAAMAYVSAGQRDPLGNWYADKRRLDQVVRIPGMAAQVPLTELLNRGEQSAKSWIGDPNPVKSMEGRRWLKGIQEMRQGIEYAKKHWDDPLFKATAETFRKSLEDHVKWQQSYGWTVPERENYIPGFYEGGYWNDHAVWFGPLNRLLGQSFRLPKKFSSPYAAISAGPYRLRSLDLAELAAHRIGQGAREVSRDVWFKALRNIPDPVSGKPLAEDPKYTKKIDPATGDIHLIPVAPSPEHVLVYTRPQAPPMAIRRGFEGLVKALVSPSGLENVPIAKDVIKFNQALKHGVILMLDTYHGSRLTQYWSALGLGANVQGGRRFARSGAAAINYRPEDIPEAVQKGLISQRDADWAMAPVELRPGFSLTRQQILQRAITTSGFNGVRMTDALYKSAVEAFPIFGPLYKQSLSRYNNWLFDRYIPGVMAESYVRNLEAQAKANPDTPIQNVFRDVAKDMNIFYGNLGRQGFFKSKTMQDLSQIAMLAPGWQEGLFLKEWEYGKRLAAAGAKQVGIDTGYRANLGTMGSLGKGMTRGLLAYFVATQAINLITRGKPTWENEEEGHKLDADLGNGLWLSPLTVFGELTHDIIRLLETKPKAWDAALQMGENRMSPFARMLMALATEQSPQHQYYANTPGLLKGAASQVVPFMGATPISFSVPAHAIAPKALGANRPGAVWRQALSSAAGVKTEFQEPASTQMLRMAREFMDKEGLTKSTGWKEVQTDEASYSKLRGFLREQNATEAGKQYQKLKETHSTGDMLKAMGIWSRRPFTGSTIGEQLFRMSLSPEQLEVYTRAQQERLETLAAFQELVMEQP